MEDDSFRSRTPQDSLYDTDTEDTSAIWSHPTVIESQDEGDEGDSCESAPEQPPVRSGDGDGAAGSRSVAFKQTTLDGEQAEAAADVESRVRSADIAARRVELLMAEATAWTQLLRGLVYS